MQILAELCSLAGAFQTVLTTIHQELVRSVYSTYYSAEAGTLQFSQVGAVLQSVPGTAFAFKAVGAMLQTCMSVSWGPCMRQYLAWDGHHGWSCGSCCCSHYLLGSGLLECRI